MPLGAGGTAESSTTTVAADLSYQAVYSGDANYPTHTGACEPLPVNVTVPCPAGLFETSINANGDLVVKYDQFPAPNDNSYGVNAVGWGTKGHTFGNLVGSDHAGVNIMKAGVGSVLDYKIDYISNITAPVPAAGISTVPPSRYASLGPFGGDGGIVTGSVTPADITWDTSLARNLNGPMAAGGTFPNPTYFSGGVQTIGTGVANLLVDSPPTVEHDRQLRPDPGRGRGVQHRERRSGQPGRLGSGPGLELPRHVLHDGEGVQAGLARPVPGQLCRADQAGRPLRLPDSDG